MAQTRRNQIVRGAVNPPRRGVRLVEQPAGQDETKRDRFIRLVEARMDKALMALDNLRKLADREYYDFSETDTREIDVTLRSEIDRLQESFKAGREIRGFKLRRE